MGEVTSDLQKLKGNGATDLGAVSFVFPEDQGHWNVVECFEDVCVCVAVEERQTQSGLILPSDDESRQKIAKVLAVGPGRTTEDGHFHPNPVKVGDIVLYGRYASAGEPFRYKGVDHLLFKARDLVGRLNPASE